MINFILDMNCTYSHEVIMPTNYKYYKKTTKRLFSTNGSQMNIKYELNIAYVC